MKCFKVFGLMITFHWLDRFDWTAETKQKIMPLIDINWQCEPATNCNFITMAKEMHKIWYGIRHTFALIWRQFFQLHGSHNSIDSYRLSFIFTIICYSRSNSISKPIRRIVRILPLFFFLQSNILHKIYSHFSFSMCVAVSVAFIGLCYFVYLLFSQEKKNKLIWNLLETIFIAKQLS